MDDRDSQKSPGLASLPALIAWLSVCMLTAAWGRALDAHLQQLWAQVGAFGLAASLGLGSLEKARFYHAKRKSDQSLRVQFDGRLAQLNEQNDVLASINDAIRQLANYAASERRGQASGAASGTSALSQYPLEILLVDENSTGFEFGSAKSIPGSLRKISSKVVSFDHGRAFAERVVVLAFKAGPRGPLCLVVEVKWTQRSDDCFASSGAVLAVGVSAGQASELPSLPARPANPV